MAMSFIASFASFASFASIAEVAGIHRVTLSRMISKKWLTTSTEHLDKLCRYFDCKVGYISDEE